MSHNLIDFPVLVAQSLQGSQETQTLPPRIRN